MKESWHAILGLSPSKLFLIFKVQHKMMEKYLMEVPANQMLKSVLLPQDNMGEKSALSSSLPLQVGMLLKVEAPQ